MKTAVTFILLICLLGRTQSQSFEGICVNLESLINGDIPRGFEGFKYELSGIEIMGDTAVYKKLPYPFAGTIETYFDHLGINKKFLVYPYASDNKDEAIQFYINLKGALESCPLVYNSFAMNFSTGIGILYAHTLNIDRRFYNSQLTLFEYHNADIDKYWIEYKITGPKTEEL